MGALYALGSTIVGLPLSAWWGMRQYYRARGKGYYPASAATMVFGGMTAAFIAMLVGVISLGSSTWSDTAIGMSLLLNFFPVPALMVTALVALLPRRPRHAGARRSSFLSSPVCRALEVGLIVAAIAAAGAQSVSLAATGAYIVGRSPGPPSVTPGGLSGVTIILAFSVASLSFARRRLNAPDLADTVTADTRPTVLYIRAFRQESDPFAYVPPKELPRYTRRGMPKPAVTFEQYLGAEFARQLGPFVALGNPLDSVPPEGAARNYAPDEDWQRHFCAHAGAAAAIVMNGSRSDNLQWELAEITRNGWQCRLFFLTAPAPPPRGRVGRRLVNALRCSAKGVRIPRWEQFAAELKQAGLHVPPIEPGPGSVMTFDAAGRAEVLMRGAQQSEEFVATVRTRL